MDYISAFLDYLQLEKKYAQHTLTSYASDLRQFQTFLSEKYDTEDFTEVSYPIIRQWIVGFVDQELTNKTINRKLSTLKTFFKFLLKVKAIEVNPMLQHKSLKLPKREQETFSLLELEKISAYFEDSSFEGLRDHLMIELLYSTGMRRQELIDLKISSVDFEQNQLKVLGKRNKERILPLLKSTLHLIQDYLNERKLLGSDSAKLFLTQSGKPIYPNLVYRTVNSYFKKVSTKQKLSPHLLRHAFASHLLEKGADITAIKDLLGHSSLASTEVYTHANFKELSKAHAASHPRSLKREDE
ncbi:tyrosine-type recombinase/integrase [Psychroflexus sp. YR1-1]|uniref:Tyrosine recombinase XerC n=1 Tax=Psychroflexus aurantiacus TaxID=2709310 RepID=A0A6B3R122_9FLAO|nr:tyrosine-type recombinase/integrase [Psychroflexus aurantiacus]NEV93912.1 tyrosine-type recombinase/integrase [Psychroflexus aurantiacus]